MSKATRQNQCPERWNDSYAASPAASVVTLRAPRCELPTTWFEGKDAKSGFLINQQVRWPAFILCAAKHRREPRNTGETLRYRHAVLSGKRGRRMGISPSKCLPGGEKIAVHLPNSWLLLIWVAENRYSTSALHPIAAVRVIGF